MQAFLRGEINGAAEELLQIFLQSEIRHSKIISGNAYVEKVNITAWLRVSARNRPEDGQLRNTVFPAQLRTPLWTGQRMLRVAPSMPSGA